MPNDEQIEYWSGEAGSRWIDYQEILDRQLTPFTEALFTEAGIKPGNAVLDIGCGCGDTTLRAAKETHSSGSVLAVDVSKPMLEVTENRITDAGQLWAVAEHGDAQTHAFEARAFDIAISRYGMMFFDDSVAAFENIRAALKPGGRLVFICWRTMAENTWMTDPLKAIAHLVELPEPPDPNAPGPFALGDGARTQKMLEDAGFENIAMNPCDREMVMGGGTELDDVVEFFFKIGPVSRVLGELDDATCTEARNALRNAFSGRHTAEGVIADGAAWLVTAGNP